MSGYSGPLSPVSVGSSEWSAISRYGPPSERTYSPPTVGLSTGQNNLITPPTSMSGSSLDGNRPRPAAQPSPPNSVGRSSNGTTLSEDGQRRKASLMEQNLAQHYVLLKRYFGRSLNNSENGNPKPNRARDKLLRLSAVQFQELSTDVYDELLRRQTANANPGPGYLLPKDDFHPKRNQARQKLSTLPLSRFQDLVVDVLYELERRFPHFLGQDIDRRGSPSSVRGPPSRTATPQGRRSGSQGQGSRKPYPARQGSLGGQVFAGLGIPRVGAQDDAFRPTAKSSQSNTIVPNKSTMVEDDGESEQNDDNYGSNHNRGMSNASVNAEQQKRINEYETQVGDLRGKVEELQTEIMNRDEEIGQLQKSREDAENTVIRERTQWADLRMDLEDKLANALSLNKNLQNEIDQIRSTQREAEQEWKMEREKLAAKNDGGEWKNAYEELNQHHQELQKELKVQQQITDEVRREATAFLNEMKAISDSSGQNWEREEKLVQQLHAVEEEAKEWKDRYARTKAQLRTMRTGSVNISIQLPNAAQSARGGEFTRPDGLVKAVHVTRFQVAIDEVLRVSRVGAPESILEHVKLVVNAIRHICEDIPDLASNSDEVNEQRLRLRTKVSSTANNFITAAKNYAHSMAISPVSLVDAAASHLCAAVIELIQIVQICPSDHREFDDDDDASVSTSSPSYLTLPSQNRQINGINTSRAPTPPNQQQQPPAPQPYPKPAAAPSKGFFGIPRKPSPARSATLPDTDIPQLPKQQSSPQIQKAFPAQPQQPQFTTTRARDPEIEDLKGFLSTQTDSLTTNIQNLISTIRSQPPSHPALIRQRISAIASIVSHVISETRHVAATSSTSELMSKVGMVLENLEAVGSKLAMAEGGGEGSDPKWKERVVPEAFECVRVIKGLEGIVDGVGEGDDFS